MPTRWRRSARWLTCFPALVIPSQDRLAAVGYRWQAYAENVAPDRGARGRHQFSWMGVVRPSRQHSESRTEGTGTAVAHGSDGRPYYVQVFGSQSDRTIAATCWSMRPLCALCNASPLASVVRRRGEPASRRRVLEGGKIVVIRRVGPLSCAKVAGLLYLILGFIFGAFVSLFAVGGVLASETQLLAGPALRRGRDRDPSHLLCGVWLRHDAAHGGALQSRGRDHRRHRGRRLLTRCSSH